MAVPKTILENNPSLDKWCILHAYRGSIAHGMYVPNTDENSIDDKDTMAVCVPPDEYYFGIGHDIFPANGTKEIKENEWDIVAYEARKFFTLLAGNNPNVLSMLWVKPQYIIKSTPEGDKLRENRSLFTSKKVYKSFTGYAYGQLHRMTHFVGRGYMGEKRGKLVEKYGYDTKNAAHLIRLLRMGIEFLTDGILNVEREDAAQLLEIKKGEWTLLQVEKEAERLFRLAEIAHIHSKLPVEPAYEDINDLSIEVIRSAMARIAQEYYGKILNTTTGGNVLDVDNTHS
jgi:predicted nucleotidyltransferase